ncbi:MAG TPA: ATP-binding protein [Anaerolineae bacterium]
MDDELNVLLKALEQRNRVLLLLNRASRILTATLEMEQVLERLLQVATQIFGAEGSSVWLWSEEEPAYLVCRAAFHLDSADLLVNQRIREGEGVAGWVAQTGESCIVTQATEDKRFSPAMDIKSGYTTLSLMAVPLQLRDTVIGVLEVVNKIDGDFTTDDLAVAETLAASASIAIDNARLVEALQQQMDDLQERNEELDAFDHTVAHDLQNPLALIVGFADVLRRNGEISEAEQQQALDLIVKNAHKMSNIVQELLILSSVRKREVKTQPVAMQPIVEEALERLAHLLKEYDASVILPESWPAAMGYGPWLEAVWENYISNAVKHGGRPPRVELGATPQPDGTITYWVRDNGPGLTREQQPMLFTPFTKLSEIRVTGHGLGLSIVRRIVEKLGGEVGVESEVGKGSVFTFTLPGVEDAGD